MGLGEQYVAGGGGVKTSKDFDTQVKRSNYVGPRRNISQSGGAFLRHPEGPTEQRRHRVPKYCGHRPYSNVVPKAVAFGGSDHFDKPPHVRGDTFVTPGFTGVIRGAQETIGQSANKLPSPSREWFDSRRKGENVRDYRGEVGGLVPGYRGHVPGAFHRIGGSNYGGLVTRQGYPDHLKWAQARHDVTFAYADRDAAASVAAQRAEVAALLFDKPGLSESASVPSMQRPASAVELKAAGIVERSRGMVPPHAALAAAQAAARGDAMRAEFASKVAAEKQLAELRVKTQSNVMRHGSAQSTGMGMREFGHTPGYNGHIPRSRDAVGLSQYHDRSLPGRDPKRMDDARTAKLPAKRPQSARGPKKGEVVQVF